MGFSLHSSALHDHFPSLADIEQEVISIHDVRAFTSFPWALSSLPEKQLTMIVSSAYCMMA